MTTAGWRSLWLAMLGACGRIGFEHEIPPDVGCVVPAPLDVACMPPAASSNGAFPGGAFWLPMDEPDPAAGIHDVDGTHVVRCATANCPMSAPGVHGNGFVFSRQQLRIDWAPDLDGSAGYSVAVWARLDAFPTGPSTATSFSCAVAEPNQMSPQPDDGDSYALCVDRSHLVYDYTTSSQRSDDTLTGLGTGAEIANLAEWHHIAATWDAVCKTKVLYVDGCRVNARSVEVRFDRGPLVVGADLLADYVTATYFWSGALDDFLFYHRVLDAAEIRLLATP